MAEELLLPGGSSVIEDFYIGPERAFRVDTDNDELRLHDGSKVGGFRFPNMDFNDARYQARQVELDGFTFGPQQRGFLTRVGPGTYRLREFIVDTDSLTIVEPFGLLGNPIWALAPQIESDHIFNGDISFIQPITATGGLLGNVIGNLLGNVTGNLTGDSIGTHTGPTNGLHTGSIDTSGGTVLMAVNQVLMAWVSGLAQEFVNRGVPLGAIMLWSGAADAVPESYALCDGTLGTPDLRDKFIIAAGIAYPVGDSGGTEEHSHTGSSDPSGAHAHNLTIAGHAITINEMPSHSHGNGVTDQSGDDLFPYGDIAAPTTSHSIDDNSADGTVQGNTESVGGGSSHTHTGSTADSGGAHTHPVAVTDTNHIPPYFSLAYIMKVV